MSLQRSLVLVIALGFSHAAVAGQILAPGDVDLSQVVATRDVDYIAGVEYQDDKDRLDIFMPEGAEGVPVIGFFHGGGLSEGTKIDGEALAARFVPAGIGVVSANYRLTPRVMHPAHVDDAAAAVAWVSRNIESYGGDPAKVYVSGHSAGAYLAVLLALDQAHLTLHSLDSRAIRGAILISPFLYVEETAPDRPKDVWGEDPADWMRASVTPHIGPGKGQMLLVYADGDEEWRKEQNERFASDMRAAGSPNVTAVQVSNRDHISLISKLNDQNDEIRDAVLHFIKMAR